MKGSKYHLDIEIDRLTNSIRNTISQDSFPTEVFQITATDLKGITKKAGWKFNWKSEAKMDDRTVYKLTIEGNSNIVQGLVSLEDRKDHIFLHLIESAFACKLSKEEGHDGFRLLLFKDKTARPL
jgi:hypothetical protein